MPKLSASAQFVKLSVCVCVVRECALVCGDERVCGVCVIYLTSTCENVRVSAKRVFLVFLSNVIVLI